MSCAELHNTELTDQQRGPTWREAAEPMVLTEIFQPQHNMVIWQRGVSAELAAQVSQLIEQNPTLQIAKTLPVDDVAATLARVLPDTSAVDLLTYSIVELTEMFCCLFELEHVGLRLKVLDKAMCPRFHVDRVPCRLVTTFAGIATQWLPHECVKRDLLGHGSGGRPDNQSGLYASASDIKTLNAGDVALLKGELWEGNENCGLVHRSPALAAKEKRLMLSLDYA